MLYDVQKQMFALKKLVYSFDTKPRQSKETVLPASKMTQWFKKCFKEMV